MAKTEYRELGGEQIPVKITAFDGMTGSLIKVGDAIKDLAKGFHLQDWILQDGPWEQAELSAGQLRALKRLSRQIVRFVCPFCLDRCKHPKVMYHQR